MRSAELGIFEEHVQHLLRCIPRDGHTIDLQPLFSSFTLDITTNVFLGRSTSLLEAEAAGESGSTEGQQFSRAFEYAQQSLIGINDYSLWRMFRKLVFGDKKLEQSLQCLGKFVDRVLDRSMQANSNSSTTVVTEDASEGTSPSSTDRHFLGAMVGRGRSRTDLKLDILNVILAGKDTTASFLGSIWYVLSQRPDIFEKLRDEIGVLNGCPPTKEDLHRFPYLQKVLQESEFASFIPLTSLPRRYSGEDDIATYFFAWANRIL